MAPYIGTSVSRVDGVAKVTGAAKYAAEVNVPGLVYGSIVGATITKGRITRIDISDALSVDGVLTVLTHQNRPRMADNDQAYKDEVAPDGSPFRPLYDDKVKFNGQDIEHETDKLDRPLEPNTAFFVQFHHDDYSKAAADVVNVSPESDPSE